MMSAAASSGGLMLLPNHRCWGNSQPESDARGLVLEVGASALRTASLLLSVRGLVVIELVRVGGVAGNRPLLVERLLVRVLRHRRVRGSVAGR